MIEIIARSSIILRLEKGEKLVEQLNRFAFNHPRKSYWLSGIGSSHDPDIGYFDETILNYQWSVREGVFEIVNLTGNLAWENGQPIWHIHGTFANQTNVTFGGHIRELIVGATCEIHLTEIAPLKRTFDAQIGLKLLDETE